MTRFCEVTGCTNQGKRSNCTCGKRLCSYHGSSVKLHQCAEAERLLSADARAWRRDNALEQDYARTVLEALALALPDLVLWQAKQRPGRKASARVALYVPDLVGYDARDARFVAVELKGSHGLDCQRKACSCRKQREWGERLVLAGGVFVVVATNTDCAAIVAQVRMQLDERRRGGRVAV